jgi:hypothetical protein
MLEVAAAIRAAQATAGRQPHDDDDLASGLAVLMTDGSAAGAPALRRALGVLSDRAAHAAPGCSRLLLGCRIARDLRDHATWSRLSSRLIGEAHRTGELHVLPGAMARLLAATSRPPQRRHGKPMLPLRPPGYPRARTVPSRWRPGTAPSQRLSG